jgi:hypothetical protein
MYSAFLFNICTAEHLDEAARVVIFPAMMIQVVIFWIVTSCSDMLGYQRFEKFAASIFRVISILAKPRVTQTVKKLPAFYGT